MSDILGKVMRLERSVKVRIGKIMSFRSKDLEFLG